MKVNNKPIPKEIRDQVKEEEKAAKEFSKVYGKLDMATLLKHINKLEQRIAALENINK